MIVEAVTARATLILAAPAPAPTFSPIEVNPNGNVPGANALRDLVNGLAAYAIIAAVAAVILGGMAWALGERLGMERASTLGKSGVIAGFGLAFLVGAAAALVQFALDTGKTASGPFPPPADHGVVGSTVSPPGSPDDPPSAPF